MRRYGWITAAIIGVLVTSAAGCGGGDQADNDGLLKVVATTGQVGEVVARVGGDRVKVTSRRSSETICRQGCWSC